jgi:hypothetical protein
MKRQGPDIAGCRWLAVVGCRSFSPLRPGGAYPTCCHVPFAFLLGNSRHVTTVHASGRLRAVRQPSDDACSTHCQIQAWIPFSQPRVSAALRPISGATHTARHRKPVSVDGPSFVPARPISLFRRVCRLADSSYPASGKRVVLSERAVRTPLTVPCCRVPRSDRGRSRQGRLQRGTCKTAFRQA